MGVEVAILGQKRLSIAQLLHDIVLLEIDELKDNVLPVYKSLYTLFNQFRENSFIHYIVENLFKNIFKNIKQDDIEKSPYKNVFLY